MSLAFKIYITLNTTKTPLYSFCQVIFKSLSCTGFGNYFKLEGEGATLVLQKCTAQIDGQHTCTVISSSATYRK
jgi:hypothetical protein